MTTLNYKQAWAESHREELRLYAKQYRAEHPEKIKAYKRNHYLRHKEYVKEYMRNYRKANPDKMKTIQAKSNAKWLQISRQDVIDLLGCKCAICGYDEDYRAFQIDHVNDNGHKDRQNFNSTIAYYRYIISVSGEGYQLLCANCNQIKEIARRESLRGN